MLASEMRSKTVSEVVKQSELFEICLVLVDRSFIYLFIAHYKDKTNKERLKNRSKKFTKSHIHGHSPNIKTN